MKNSVKYILFFLIISINLSCGYRIKNYGSINEFLHDGFIDTNIYQTMIISQPEKDVIGHVNQRDSAYLNAKKSIPDTVAANLAKYCIDKKTAASPANFKISVDTESNLKIKLHKYVNYGKITYEYYNENNSIVLGYRIEKKGLKYEIDSISFALK
jgi:hypothetical protein